MHSAKNNSSWLAFAVLAAFGSVALPSSLHGAQRHATPSTDAQWMQSYANVCDDKPCAHPDAHHTGGDIKWDPRFQPLLRATLPQTQGWWTNASGGRASVRDAVMAFVGIPGHIHLDQARYLTIDGCVPHACTTKGMLWIDTVAHPAVAVFVGEQLVVGQRREESGYHLMLYTSRAMSTYTDANSGNVVLFPSNFVSSLDRWHKANVSKEDDQRILLATVFSPSEHSHDYLYDDFFHQLKYAAPADKPGVTP